jgi:hypothetical protein
MLGVLLSSCEKREGEKFAPGKTAKPRELSIEELSTKHPKLKRGPAEILSDTTGRRR